MGVPSFDSEEVMASLLICLAGQLRKTALLTHQTPHGRQLLDRMGQPQVGDLVVVHPVIGTDVEAWRQVGFLVEEPTPGPDRTYLLWHPITEQPTTTRWENVTCTALPVATRGMVSGLPADGLFLPGARVDRIPRSLWGVRMRGVTGRMVPGGEE